MLKVIKYTNANALEATWFDKEGHQIRSIAYADVQMQMLRNDVELYGGNISQYEALIAEVESNIVPIVPSPMIPPSLVSMRQARLALLQAGLLATVNTSINSGGEADKIEWEYAADVDMNSPLVQNMKIALSLSDADLDNLFTLAATL